MLSVRDQQQLLIVARTALESQVRGTRDEVIGPSVDLRVGAFVTIQCRGQLRGCLGRLSPTLPLTELVRELARAVAHEDPRFDPVAVAELADLSVEVSLLTPEVEVSSVEEIEVGRHGLIVERGARRGLLLPQVPAEYGWDRETFLAHTCLKAGLPSDAWRRGARIYIFEAQIIREDMP